MSDRHRSRDTLDAALPTIASSPRSGRLQAIVVRPDTDLRDDLTACRLSERGGAEGDRWSKRHPDPSAKDLESQLTLINTRALELVAGGRDRWALAGDQLYVDLDLSVDHLAPGDRVRVGGVVLEITPKPHRGCSKFAARFGADALAWLASPEGERLRLRGIYARVVVPGEVHVGDAVAKLVGA